MRFFFFFFQRNTRSIKRATERGKQFVKKLCQMEQTKIMRRMRKGNSSSKFALNMPAGEQRQKRGAAYCMGVGRLFPAAAHPLVLALCPELLIGDNREEGEQKGKRSPSHRRITRLPSCSSRRRTPCCCYACTSWQWVTAWVRPGRSFLHPSCASGRQ